MSEAIYIVDTETNDKNNPQVIELAWINLSFPELVIKAGFDQFYKPSEPISLGAMATHHIMEEDLEGCPSHEEAVNDLPEIEYMIGHQIDFDWRALGEPEGKRICTLALSRFLLPDLDSHTQSALMYFFLGKEAKPILKDAHNAMADVKMCRVILDNLLEHALLQGHLVENFSMEDIYQLSELARIPTKIPFGKHAGSLISELPWDYKQWILREEAKNPGNFDLYLIKAIKDSSV